MTPLGFSYTLTPFYLRLVNKLPEPRKSGGNFWLPERAATKRVARGDLVLGTALVSYWLRKDWWK